MAAGNLAEKLDLLFRTVHPADRGPYTYQEVSQALGGSDGGAGLSASAIRQLRTGAKANPTMRTVESLARFFNVPPAYFFSDGQRPPARPGHDLDPELQAAVRVPQVRSLAVAAAALSPQSRDLVQAVVVRLSELEAPIATPQRRRGRSRRPSTARAGPARGR